MIGTLTRRKSFLVWDEDLVIDVADFCSNVLDLYSGSFKIHCRPNDETVGYPEQKVRLKVVDWMWRDTVSGGHYSHS